MEVGAGMISGKQGHSGQLIWASFFSTMISFTERQESVVSKNDTLEVISTTSCLIFLSLEHFILFFAGLPKNIEYKYLERVNNQ